ncbi:MAG: hypothetical protein C4582_02625 [Desulfobacteraceae bacterium]|nr:MAG: hypothetical protein C4582_02625 [Desulfobacteraceae bacterium]
MNLTAFFYIIKPFIPRRVQLILRSRVALYKRKKHRHRWPVLESAGKSPAGWPGWPEGKQFAFVLLHDVDTWKGHERARALASLEERFGFRSCFNFVPEGYPVSKGLRDELRNRGFEVGVHGLTHDGKLFSKKEIFLRRAVRINKYLKDWGAVGFSSPSMHHKLEWMHEINMEYDISTFDTDPFEPQPDGAGVIFPFWYQRDGSVRGFVELPYTLPQDFTLFVLLKEKGTAIWKQKLDWIADKGGMALLDTHPDYMCFTGVSPSYEEYSCKIYEDFLNYVKKRYNGLYWHVLPRDVAAFWIRNVVNRP